MKAVVFAYHDFGCVGIQSLLDAGFDIAAVFTHADDPTENHYFASVAQVCAANNLAVYAPENVNHPLWVKRIRDMKADVIFSFYYRNIISEDILQSAKAGAYNLHGSLLPKYRGRAPLNWVLVNGESETGVTLHKMVARADAGDIAGQIHVAISDTDTAHSLQQKMIEATRELLNQQLPLIRAGDVVLVKQDEKLATRFGRRTPADGELFWNKTAKELYNLVRAVTLPYPGAYTFAGDRKLMVWESSVVPHTGKEMPGTIINVDPFTIACGKDALEIRAGQSEQGLYVRGTQLAKEMGLVTGMYVGPRVSTALQKQRKTRVLILGINGFIGNHLTERLLQEGRYEVYGMDIGSDALDRFAGNPDFHFLEGDISIHTEWIEYHIKKCEVILPLVAIATPIEYTRNPLRVFELDFEENLKIVRYCVKYGKRIIFPSTSEVYGMCSDDLFDEDRSNLTVGPINKQRWIYSTSKQLLDRIIWAYGKKENLKFTLFRPFNWMGPRLDTLNSARIGSSRAITQLILNLTEGTPIKLIDGGAQKRCFTDVNDGIEALFRIIENKDNKCNGQIINIGNPDNEASIRELAEMLCAKFESHPLRSKFPPFAGMVEVESHTYYGDGYQDVSHRRPSIENAKKLLGWVPAIGMEATIEETLDFFLKEAVKQDEA